MPEGGIASAEVSARLFVGEVVTVRPQLAEGARPAAADEDMGKTPAN